MHGRFEIVKFLIENNADVNIKSSEVVNNLT
jgi:hypothetical protein